MLDHVLVINAGSSSLKYQLVDPRTGERRASGMVERIGDSGSNVQHTVDGARSTRAFDCPD
ncbi:MAG: acetate kinase, partial [Ornithinimicrobium sp.]